MKAVAAGLGLLLAVQVGGVLVRYQGSRVPTEYEAGTAAVARLLFSPRFLYVFEATSILILAALVGAVALAKREP